MNDHWSFSDSSDNSMDHPSSFARDKQLHNKHRSNKKKEKKKQEKQEKERQEQALNEQENVRQRKKTTDEETNPQRMNNRGQAFPSQEKQKEDKSGEKCQKKQQTTEEEHPTQAGGRRLVLLKTVCFLVICVPLLAFIIHQHITIKALRDQLNSCNNTIKAERDQFNSCNNTIKAERDQLNSCNNKVVEFNSLQEDFTELTTEKDLCFEFSKRTVMADLRIMVVGKTGAGKSASGNTILGEKVFEEKMSSESVTRNCLKRQQKVEGGKISVIDTPGLFDTEINKKIIEEELEKCVSMSVPGPHVFLLVVRLDVRFTDEEKKTVKWIQENFGEKAANYSIILFTRGDQIDEPIEEFLEKNRQIEELVRQCKNRYHVFNNKDKNPSQVNKLLDKIVRMVMENGGGHYTNEMYKEAQKKQREEDERRKLEEEEKINKEVQKRQREENERRKLEEEEKINKKVQERLREEYERQKLEKRKKKSFWNFWN